MFDPKICISGAAGGNASEEGELLAYQIGKEIAARGGIIITGATTGVPLAAAKGAKSIHGQVVGFSPASSYKEHVNKYHLPIQHHDMLFFTGQDYAGRDVLLVDLADAMIEISGRIGTLHEFTHAFERDKIIGVLLHSGGTIDEIPEILHRAHRGNRKVVLSDDPKKLVQLVFDALEEENKP
jgi:uncharacterized protein (TIGR00725 family)